ncbi:MAG TPA: hypothetical protein VJ776_09255, partial [Thermoanaerobaculia bacterium]|nr:hypothetical protein [Thermoanaerobaculia bacterium]
PGTCASGLFTDYGTAMNDTSLTCLTPTYIATVPRADGWGRANLYNVTSPGDNYNLISYGRDNSKTPGTPICGTTTDFNDDIIYSNGTFLQWPEGTQQ